MRIVNFDRDVCAMTDVGLVREHNEDSNRVESTSNGDLFVVCDGMGGHVGGATASRIGVDSICRYVNDHQCVVPQRFLADAISDANGKIYGEACQHPELKGMGTTACVALVREDKVWYAHVGDSRIYYYNKRLCTLYRLTKDHSVVQALIDQGLIAPEEAAHHPERNKILKSLGVKSNVEAEVCQMPLSPAEGDLLLLCSDGLSGMMDDDDILQALATVKDVNVTGKALMDLAKAGGGTDNITLQLIRFCGMGEREATFDAKGPCVSLQSSAAPVVPRRSRLSSWLIVTLMSAVFLLIGCFFLLRGGNDSHQQNDEMTQQQEIRSQGPAYLNEIPSGAQGEDFVNNGHRYRFYSRPGSPDGDLLVDLGDGSFEIGQFEQRPKVVDGKKTYIYVQKNTRKFNANGEPIM